MTLLRWYWGTLTRSPIWAAWVMAMVTACYVHGLVQIVLVVWATALALYVWAMLRFERAYEQDRRAGLAALAWLRARDTVLERITAFARDLGEQLTPIFREMAAQFNAVGESVRLWSKMEGDRQKARAVGIDPDVFEEMVGNCRLLSEISGFSFEEIYDRAWARLYEDACRGEEDQVDALRYAATTLGRRFVASPEFRALQGLEGENVRPLRPFGHRQIPERDRRPDL